MRLSKKFIKGLEALAEDPKLTPTERLEAAGLLVRMYTAAPPRNDNTKPKPHESDTLSRLAEGI